MQIEFKFVEKTIKVRDQEKTFTENTVAVGLKYNF